MPIALCRVDDRLIHGQVVIGWGAPLAVDRIALVDDAIRANAWEQEIYRMAVPASIALEFLTGQEAAGRLRAWDSGTERVFILAGEVATMAALVEAGEGLITRINLGGLHERPGRRERLRYLYLSDEEARDLRRLEAAGALVTAQDLPSATPVPLHELLR
jgi:mannose/fructose/N-acetylgalactosamine-specific phosphotransferase system component IIB